MIDRMELTQMRYAVALAETRNFTRAAERCHVVQSALSQQIKVLERELGVTLFARTSRKVDMTQAGEAFVVAAKAALLAVDHAATQATAAAGMVSGQVTIGAVPTMTALHIPDLVKTLRLEHPGVRVAVRIGGSDELLEAVGAGDLDVAVLCFMEEPDRAGVRVRELARDQLVVALHPGHRLASHSILSLADVADDTFVDFPSGSAGRIPTDMAFSRAGVVREVAFESAATNVMLDMIQAGVALGILPSRSINSENRLIRIPLRERPVRVEYLAWRDFNPRPATQALLSLIS